MWTSADPFQRLWAASAVSSLSDGMTAVAAPLLAATVTRDPSAVAGLAFGQRLPWVVLALFSGALADRVDRRHALAASALCRGGLIGSIGVTVVAGVATLPMLYAAFFLVGVAETVFDISAATLVPALVATPELPRANARLAGTLTVCTLILGPALGSLVFGVWPAAPFLIGAASLYLSAAAATTLSGGYTVEQSRPVSVRQVLEDVGSGLRWLWRQRLLRTLSLVLGAFDLTLVAQNAIMVLFLQDRFGRDAEGYGRLVALYGVGGLLGSGIAGRLVARFRPGALLRAAVVVETAYPVALALAHSSILASVAFFAFGVHAVVWGALISALRQELTPAELRGRVESAYRFVEQGAAAPGALVGGGLAAHFGLAAPFWLGGLVGVVALLGAWTTFSSRVVHLARSAVPLADARPRAS